MVKGCFQKSKNLFSSPTSSLNFTFCDRMKRFKEHNEGFLFQIILKALPFMEREYFQKQFKLFQSEIQGEMHTYWYTGITSASIIWGFLSLNLIDNNSIIQKQMTRQCLWKCSKKANTASVLKSMLFDFLAPISIVSL